MKIAIQGHPTRGKEVIQILESLDGSNPYNYSGDNPACYYEIHGNTILCACTKSNNYKYYTLEEFEEAFPFKVGDRVIYRTTDFIGTIIKLENSGYYYIKCDNGNLVCSCRQNLKFYKEMKEKRNITLTLNKAKEWYNKGGELREIALQAFTEKELNSLPRSWEEFCKQGDPVASWRYNIPIKHEAIFKLEQLRDCWRRGWEPDWNDIKQAKYCICYYQGRFKTSELYETRYFLSFPTRKMAEEFLECFRVLIEQAGDLI